MDDRDDIYYLKRNNDLLEWMTVRLHEFTDSSLLPKPYEFTEKEIPLKAAPFQPECKCKVIRDKDENFTIYHCQYHRSIAYIYGELLAISEVKERVLGSSRRGSIVDLLSFLDTCKENSLTGQIGKARDENIGR